MDIRARAARVGYEGGGARQANVSYLSMYAEQPDDEMTLEDVEICAEDRLRGM